MTGMSLVPLEIKEDLVIRVKSYFEDEGLL